MVNNTVMLWQRKGSGLAKCGRCQNERLGSVAGDPSVRYKYNKGINVFILLMTNHVFPPNGQGKHSPLFTRNES